MYEREKKERKKDIHKFPFYQIFDKIINLLINLTTVF